MTNMTTDTTIDATPAERKTTGSIVRSGRMTAAQDAELAVVAACHGMSKGTYMIQVTSEKVARELKRLAKSG